MADAKLQELQQRIQIIEDMIDDAYKSIENKEVVKCLGFNTRLKIITMIQTLYDIRSYAKNDYSRENNVSRKRQFLSRHGDENCDQ